jgi:hypothetical protein
MCADRKSVRHAELRVGDVGNVAVRPERTIKEAFDPSVDALDFLDLDVVFADEVGQRVERSRQHAAVRIVLEGLFAPEIPDLADVPGDYRRIPAVGADEARIAEFRVEDSGITTVAHFG